MNRRIIFLGILIFLGGCATVTGPSVSKEEITAARNRLEARALRYQIEKVKKINEIGYHIVRSIPQEDIGIKPRPFLGLFGLSHSKITKIFFDEELKRGVFIAFVLQDTPAAKAGLKKGDLLLKINKRRVNTVKHLVHRVYKLKPGEVAELEIMRRGISMNLPIMVEELPVDVRFAVVDQQDVNASATGSSVHVTYGLLNFVKSDDEIATVIGHELGHVARGHVGRLLGSKTLSSVAALGLGIAAEIFSPGSGKAVRHSVGGATDLFARKFSRNLEREADYFGIKYIYHAGYDPRVAVALQERFAVEVPKSMISNYLSTHPSSPERSVRIQKTINELEWEKMNPNPDGI